MDTIHPVHSNILLRGSVSSVERAATSISNDIILIVPHHFQYQTKNWASKKLFYIFKISRKSSFGKLQPLRAGSECKARET